MTDSYNLCFNPIFDSSKLYLEMLYMQHKIWDQL